MIYTLYRPQEPRADNRPMPPLPDCYLSKASAIADIAEEIDNDGMSAVVWAYEDDGKDVRRIERDELLELAERELSRLKWEREYDRRQAWRAWA